MIDAVCRGKKKKKNSNKRLNFMHIVAEERLSRGSSEFTCLYIGSAPCALPDGLSVFRTPSSSSMFPPPLLPVWTRVPDRMAGAKRTESPCDSDQEVKSELRKSASDQQQNNAATPLRTSSTMASDGGQRYRRDQQSEHSAARCTPINLTLHLSARSTHRNNYKSMITTSPWLRCVLFSSSYIIRSATVARAGETDPGSAWALECARILSNFSAPGNAAYSPGSALHACVEWSSV